MKQRLPVKGKRVGSFMRINYAAYIFLFLLTTVSCSQPKKESQKEMSHNIKRENDFSDKEVLEYHEFLQSWQIAYFNNLLKSSGFLQDCVDCSDIVWEAQLTIDKSGKISDIIVLNRDVQCPNKSDEQIRELESKVLESFKNQKMPDLFKSMILQVKIGRVSRC